MANLSDVACLVTQKGPLFIYDGPAISNVLAQLLDSVVKDSTEAWDVQVVDQTSLYDGFTAESWCQYARKKSNIASRLCRETCARKARLSNLKANLS